jgi:hypothetical protein
MVDRQGLLLAGKVEDLRRKAFELAATMRELHGHGSDT